MKSTSGSNSDIALQTSSSQNTPTYNAMADNPGQNSAPQKPTAQPQPTIVLQPGSDGKPAITLTVYKHERGSPYNTPEPLVRIFEPSAHSVVNATTAALDIVDDTFSQPMPPCMDLAVIDGGAMGDDAHGQPLSVELEEHFQGLKVEFEEATGRGWNPLTAWGSEEWEWEDGCEGEPGLFDWT